MNSNGNIVIIHSMNEHAVHTEKYNVEQDHIHEFYESFILIIKQFDLDEIG